MTGCWNCPYIVCPGGFTQEDEVCASEGEVVSLVYIFLSVRWSAFKPVYHHLWFPESTIYRKPLDLIALPHFLLCCLWSPEYPQWPDMTLLGVPTAIFFKLAPPVHIRVPFPSLRARTCFQYLLGSGLDPQLSKWPRYCLMSKSTNRWNSTCPARKYSSSIRPSGLQTNSSSIWKCFIV